MKRIIASNKGVALFMALILGLVSVMFLSALLYMISTGTRMSGLERTYSTAVEAARGGADIVCRLLRRGGVDVQDLVNAPWVTVRDQQCLSDKLENETSNWTNCTNGCEDEYDDLTDIRNCYDLRTTAGSYEVNVKIVDTKSYINAHGDTCYIYTIHALSISNDDPNDKAWITFLYRVEP